MSIFFLFISGLIIGSHIGLMSMLGWLITWSVQWMNVDSLSFLILEFSSLLIMLASSHWNLCFCSHECPLFWIYLFPHLLCSACIHLFLFVRVCMSLLCIVFLTYYVCLSHWNLSFCSHECSATLDLYISPFLVIHLCSFKLLLFVRVCFRQWTPSNKFMLKFWWCITITKREKDQFEGFWPSTHSLFKLNRLFLKLNK